MPSSFEVTIRARTGWQPVDFKEIFLYRELLAFLVWRDIKIRYRQTLLTVGRIATTDCNVYSYVYL